MRSGLSLGGRPRRLEEEWKRTGLYIDADFADIVTLFTSRTGQLIGGGTVVGANLSAAATEEQDREKRVLTLSLSP